MLSFPFKTSAQTATSTGANQSQKSTDSFTKKYNFSKDEIDFIEKMIRPMP